MFATLRKEFLILLRDPGGLLLLLIMPAALIIVMTLVQDAPFRDYQEMKFEILVANKDRGTIGSRIVEGLKKSDNFIVIEELNGQPLSEQTVKADLKEGHHGVAIIIPENATLLLVNTSNLLANTMAKSMGMPATLPESSTTDSSAIEILFDPVVKPSFRTSLNYAISQYLTQIKIEIVLERMSKMSGSGSGDNKIDLSPLQVLAVKEQSLDKEHTQSPSMNAVQHNVPAWAIFGMFLIVVPISGNMIRERDEGSAVRIQLIPSATRMVGLGKITFYILVCLLQFFVMMLVGIFLLPWFGLPALSLGAHPEALLPVATAIAFSAVSYGYFIGSIFKTANQAMPFGAISVVLFSAMGGVWVPVEILPPTMRTIANFSPLHWSLRGVNEVILRGDSIPEVAIPLLILTGLGIVLSVLPIYFGRK